MKIGVVILNYNTWQDTIVCIDSIRKFSSQNYHIYVVDNLSKDDSVKHLESIYSDSEDVSVIKNEINGGYSAGNNVGIKKAVEDCCDIVFIVNSDVELLNDAFYHMSNTLYKNDKFMMVGPSIINNEGNESQLLRSKVTLKSFIYARQPFSNFKIFQKKGNRVYKPNSDIFSFSGSVSGCCFGMRSDDFVDIGYLDEGVFLYGEESILAYKMENLNRKAVFDATAKIWHKESVSTSKEGSAFVQYYRWSGAIYILKKYAKINTVISLFIAFWNIAFWMFLSIKSKDHRKMLKTFCKKNLENATVR